MFSDFFSVREFLKQNHRLPNWFNTPLCFEYSHMHSNFQKMYSHRFGIWEDDGEIVAAAYFEMELGEYIPCVKPGYEHLRTEMLSFAERELSKKDHAGSRTLEIFSTDKQGLNDFYSANGYTIARSNAILIYPYDKGFNECKLPEGFTLHTLEEENNIEKIDCCFWEGFGHGEWSKSEEREDGRLNAMMAPNFRADLATVVKAPNSDYACIAEMWVDDNSGYAYLEPLATRPKYRRMGLATEALMESMKKTVPYGANYCYCGSIDFYRHLGCEQAGTLQMWKKTW